MQQINDQETAQSSGRLSQALDSLLLSNGGYLADKLYSFSPEHENVSLIERNNDATTKLSWLVLAREHYFETSKDYPIANKKDLVQALRFEDNVAPFQGVTFHHIARINEQSHKVTFWVVNPKALALLPSQPWFIFPESYLLAKTFANQQCIGEIKRVTTPLYLAKVGETIKSGVQSMYTPDIESFAVSTGVAFESNFAEDIEVNADTLREVSFAELLCQGVKATSLVKIKDFFVAPQKQIKQSYSLPKIAAICGTVLVVYLLVSSAWLVFKEYRVELALNEQAEQVNQALDLQKQYQQQLAWQEQLSVPYQDLEPYWNAWQVFIEIIASEAEVKSLQLKNGEITVRGKAKKNAKATDVLVKLNEIPYIVSPRFIAPIRKHKGLEEFAISFSFLKGADSLLAVQEGSKQELLGVNNATTK